VPSRRTFLGAVGAGGLGALAGCTDDDPVDGRWYRAGYDDRNTGHAPRRRGPGSDPTVRWSADVPESYHTPSPVLADDRVYLGHASGGPAGQSVRVGLRVLDAGVGEARRDVTVTTLAGVDTSDARYLDSLVFADGALYLVAYDGLYSLTPDGEERWHVPMGGGPTNSGQRTGHPVVVDGTVFAPTASTTDHADAPEALYAVDADSGDVRWRYVPAEDAALDARPGDPWTFPPAYADGVVYLGVLDHGVVALDARDGTVRWRKQIRVYGPPTLADGRVYASIESPSDERSHVVALDAASGKEDWRTTDDGSRLGRRIAAADGRVYHRENLETLVARDAGTGEQVWRYAGADNVYAGTPAVTDDAIYVCVHDDDSTGVAALDPSTGEREGFASAISSPVYASLALSNGLAVVVSSSGRAYAFEACSAGVAGHCLF